MVEQRGREREEVRERWEETKRERDRQTDMYPQTKNEREREDMREREGGGAERPREREREREGGVKQRKRHTDKELDQRVVKGTHFPVYICTFLPLTSCCLDGFQVLQVASTVSTSARPPSEAATTRLALWPAPNSTTSAPA